MKTHRCQRCDKVRFDTHLEVRYAILKIWKRIPTRRLWFYECPHIPNTWHMTSQQRTSSRR